jgi:hypothetical protein
MQSTNNIIIANEQTILKPVNIYFKEAWTSNAASYCVYPDWTLNQFIDALKPLIAIDFDMAADSFKIVEAGQPAGENGLPIDQSNDIKIKDLWGSDLNVSFYIRR